MIDIQLIISQTKSCPVQYVRALKDTLEVLSGKWKLAIISSLLFEKKRFIDIQRNIPKITPRMLSKELKDLEASGVITRIIHEDYPVSIEYALTPSGRNISEVLDKMIEWGICHRNAIVGNSEN